VSLSERRQVALFALGGIMLTRVVPSLFVGPAAGVLADRYNRTRLMVFCDLARAALFLGIAFGADLTAIFALTFIIECMSLVFVAAKDSSLPVIVPQRQLDKANQLNLLVTYGTLPIGAVVAAATTGIAALLGRGGLEIDPIRAVLGLNALSYLVSGLLYSRVRLPTRTTRAKLPEDEPLGVLAELRGGLGFINERPLIRSLILGVVGIFFGAGVVVTLGPEFVRSDLGRPEADWSVLMTAVGLGLVVGIGLVGLLTRRWRKEKVFPVALALTGGLAAAIATLPSFTLTLVFGGLLGAAAGTAFVIGYTLLGEATPDEIRGRTFAAFYTATRLALFLSLAVAPFLAGFIGDGIIIFGDFRLFPSGTRVAIFAGGMFGLFAALSAGTGMRRSLDAGEAKRLPGPDRAQEAAEGVFISFEGGEGSGKSTQVAALVATLEAEGHDVVVTREPGGAPIAERVRHLVLDPNTDGMHPRTEALLYAAARAEHVSRVILPALQAGKVVVCDRFLDSSLAYQGYGRGLGEEAVFEINRWAIEGVLPSAVVLLTLDVEEGLRRAAERARRRAAESPRSGGEVPVIPFASVPDRIESENLAFHRAVAAGYLELARRDRQRFVVVDASGDPESVARQVRSALHGVLPLPEPEARPTDVASDPAAESG